MSTDALVVVGALAALAVSVPGPASAQDAWRWESPRPQGNTLRDACVDDAGQLWVAGEAGTLGRTDARGSTWEPAGVTGTRDLHRIACCGGAVIAVGVEGAVVRRDASGVHESRAGTATLTGVACVGERGFAISSGAGELWVSEAGGEPVRRAAPHPLFALHAAGGALLASGPAGAISRTSDLGRRWSTAETGTGGNVLAIAGDDRELVAVGTRGIVLSSADGGESWRTIPSGVEADLFAVARTATETVAVGAAEVAIAARRGRPFASIGALSGRYHGLVATGGRWVAVGASGRIASRAGSGRFTIAPRRETSLYATWWDGTTRIVVGDRGLLERATGGGPLRPVRIPTVVALHAVTGNAAGVVLAVGAEGTILRSQDRGARWSRIAVPADRTFNSVWLDDEGHALAVGERGQRYRSDDGGRTWDGSASLTNDDHFTAIASRGSTLWVVGVGARIERSDDLGRTWVAEAPPPGTSHLRGAIVTARGTLIVVARPGTVARRPADGPWTVTELRSDALLSAISGDASTLVIVASDGSSLVSRDDGRTWTPERPITHEVLTSVRVGPDGRTVVTGYWGILLARP